MKKRVADLEGAELDYAVALALGHSDIVIFNGKVHVSKHEIEFSASKDWSIGGPIIERHEIELSMPGPSFSKPPGKFLDVHHPPGPWRGVINWEMDGYFTQYGKTPLIAAMRCFVASKFGEYIELPVAA